jgi:hypothetical protein
MDFSWLFERQSTSLSLSVEAWRLLAHVVIFTYKEEIKEPQIRSNLISSFPGRSPFLNVQASPNPPDPLEGGPADLCHPYPTPLRMLLLFFDIGEKKTEVGNHHFTPLPQVLDQC